MLSRLGKCCIHIQQRWIFAIMCFLALFNAYAMRACLSITITKMTVPLNTSEISSIDTEGLYDWDENKQHVIISAFFWGYIITHIPGGIIADRYGGKYTLGIGVFLTAIFTVVTPPIIKLFDSTGLLILRFFMGLGEGTTYPAINVLLAQWTPPEERSRTGSFVYAGALMGTIYATTVSGVILQNIDKSWPIVFYVLGTASIVWFFVWSLLCYNSPNEHPFISKNEVNFLKERMSEHVSDSHLRIPWRHILLSKPLWAVVIGLIGYNWAILTLINDLPKYMDNVLKFSVQSNGFLSSSVYLSMWIGGMLSSWLADYLIANDKMSTTRVRKCGSVLALTVSACIIMIVPWAGDHKYLVVCVFNLSLFVMGTAFPSVMINALDLSPNHAGTLMALTNGLSAITGMVSPLVIGAVAPDQTIEQWRVIFVILFAISVITNVIFVVFGSGEVQYWNDPDFESKARNAKFEDKLKKESKC